MNNPKNLDLLDSGAWDRAVYMEKLEDVRYEERQRADRAIRTVVPAADWLLVASGASFCLCAVSLYSRSIEGAVWFGLAALLARWTCRRIRDDWQNWHPWEEDDDTYIYDQHDQMENAEKATKI